MQEDLPWRGKKKPQQQPASQPIKKTPQKLQEKKKGKPQKHPCLIAILFFEQKPEY